MSAPNIQGYRDLTQDELDAIDLIKAAEVAASKVYKDTLKRGSADPRAMALAKSNLQQGFMWMTRAIGNPSDPFGE